MTDNYWRHSDAQAKDKPQKEVINWAQAPVSDGPSPVPPKQPKHHGWIVAIVAIICVFATVGIGISSCSSAVSSYSTLAGMSDTSSFWEDLDGDAVGVIEMSGTIQYDGSTCSPEGLKELLDQAEEDNRIKAIVLRVNSGGGVATAGEEMTTYLREFSKPVVVSSASLNASAAYEISSQADYIYVANTTEIGAIGTIMTMADISELLDKLGVQMETIASADSKDASYGFRSLTPEEREYYQNMVTEINEVFIQNVAEGRNLSDAQVRELATGLVYTGKTACTNGLADEVGTLEDAENKAASLAGITDFEVVELRPTYDMSLLGSLLSTQATELATKEALKALAPEELVGLH